MGLRQLGLCACRTARSPLRSGGLLQAAGPGHLGPVAILSPARFASDRPFDKLLSPSNPSSEHPLEKLLSQHSTDKSPRRPAGNRSSHPRSGGPMPPRPPPERSPWASRGSSPAYGRGGQQPRQQPQQEKQLAQDTADLPGLIRWDLNDFLQKNHMRAGPPQEMRLRPSTGRTVHRTGRVDVPRAFQLLNRMVYANNVKRDLQMQRFHERPGLKRKRLRSERWRKRFKHGFQAVVRRVAELKSQGW